MGAGDGSARPRSTSGANSGGRRLGGIRLDQAFVAALAIAALASIVGAVLASSSAPGAERPTQIADVNTMKPTTNLPAVDTDHDGLPDIDENYVYGTDPKNPDTDGDGMPDWWEVKYNTARDPATNALLIDPLNPSDAYGDPDQDGYDYNNNGRIDTYQDSVVRSNLSIPAKAQYDARLVCAIENNQLDLDGKLLHLERVAVMDNGTYGAASTTPSTEIDIKVVDSTTAQQGVVQYVPNDGCSPLRIILEPGSNRPYSLYKWNRDATGGWAAGDLINIEGVFHVDPADPNNWWLTVRGGEGFPNIQEYQTWRDYNGTGQIIGANPLVRDTDGDGMTDGFEAHYGTGTFEPANGTFVWKWDFFMSPVDPNDAGLDPDHDGIRITWQQKVAACLLRDVNNSCITEVPQQYSPGDFVVAGTNLDEFYTHTRPDLPDTDGDTFPPPEPGSDPAEWNTADMQEYLVLHTDPTKADTDGDGMPDGWEAYYGLLPNDSSDRLGDPDGDGLLNYWEYANPICSLNPKNNDTDGDGMPDGWEVQYQLDACHDDSQADVDLTHGVLTPDGLTNIQEYFAGTSPRLVDTDADNLSDFDEVTKNWTVFVEGQAQQYKTDPTKNDTDLDGLTDWQEVMLYGTNASNPDTDIDGLPDAVELFTDRNPDKPGIQATSPNRKDTDGDGLTDWEEVPHQDGALITCLKVYLPGYTDAVERCTDPLNPDTDGDGLSDGFEVHTDFAPTGTDGSPDPIINSTDPLNPDTDGDGLSDGYEFDNSDLDGDGLPTRWEIDHEGLYPLAYEEADANGNGIPDVQEDWDGDGLTLLQEYEQRTDPFLPDTNNDGVMDGQGPADPFAIPRLPVYHDSDGDGMPDWWERQNGFDPFTPDNGCASDADGDGFANLDEYLYNTNPRGAVDSSIPDKFNHPIIAIRGSCDTDGDGIANWYEEMYGLDPNDPTDADRNLDRELNATGAVDANGVRVIADNWTNYQEYIYAADPYNHISTDPTTGDSDYDAWNLVIRPDGSFNVSKGLKQNYDKFYTDDVDPDPVVLWHFARPVNPTAVGGALNPIVAGQGAEDMDRDGLNNTMEALKGTSAFDPDTDGDGMPDGWEVQYAVANLTTGKPILDPLYPDDANQDPDNDGWNYSRARDPTTGDPVIVRADFNGDGVTDNRLDNEQFSNVEEYWFGDDTNGDGINDQTTNPGKKETINGIVDGYLMYFQDRDFDGLPRWYEAMFKLNDANRVGEFGGQGDPDLDGAMNVIEAQSTPWTNPRDPLSVPPICSWPRIYLPDPNTPPAGWPC